MVWVLAVSVWCCVRCWPFAVKGENKLTDVSPCQKADLYRASTFTQWLHHTTHHRLPVKTQTPGPQVFAKTQVSEPQVVAKMQTSEWQVLLTTRNSDPESVFAIFGEVDFSPTLNPAGEEKKTTTTTVHFMRFIPWQTVLFNIDVRLSMYLICCVTRFNVLRWFTMRWGCRQNLNHGTLHTFCTKTATLCLFLLYLYREKKKKRSFGRLNFFSRTAAFFSHARIIEEVRQFIFLITCIVCIFIIIRAMFGQGHY